MVMKSWKPLLGLILTLSPSLAQAPSDRVNVDHVRKRAEILVERPDGQVVIYLEPVSNLLFHTLNMYDLFGGQGTDYGLRNDQAARKAVDFEIRAQFNGKDRYFSRQGTVSLYSPTMKAFLEQQAYLKNPDQSLLAGLAPAPFNTALIKTWDAFYREYWDRRFQELTEEFRKMDANVRWSETLVSMEQVSGRQWQGTMRVFAVEATGKSAFTFAKTVCVGTLEADNDAGFVHEGLHLLLGEEWATSPRINQFMAGVPFDHRLWGSDWSSFYEQAFVVLADLHLRNLRPRKQMSQEEFLRLNLEGNGVGELSEIALDVVLPYLRNPDGHVEEVMWHLVRRAEAQRRAVKK